MGNHVLYYALTVVAYFQLSYQENSSTPKCDTPNCKKLADYYNNNMNKQGEPCNDFYDYVCHNWGVYYPRTKDKALWNVDHWLGRRSLEDLKHSFENVEATTNGIIFSQAKAVYIACMNLPFMKRSNSKTKSVMATAGYFPMFAPKDSKVSQDDPWWKTESYYISNAGESSIFDFRPIGNTHQNNEITILISPLSSPHGMLKLFAPFHISHRKQYKAFLMNVINTIAPFDTKSFTNMISADLDDVIKFREEMKGISKIPNITNDTVFITLAEFQKLYNRYAAGQESAQINWLEIIRAMYKNSKNKHPLAIQNAPNMLVPLSYFSNLAIILATTPKRVIANHIHLYFAERHVELSTQMERNLENSLILDARPTGQIRYERERWETCVRDHNMVRALGYMYIQSHFPDKNKHEVEKLTKDLVQFLKLRIWESSWLDTDVKNKTMHKLDMLQSQIGYPDWYFPATELSKAPTLPDVNPIHPNIYYAGTKNRISASASYLQWPIYMPDMPYAAKYGATGFAIAHELNHVVDHTGIRYDYKGIENKWWPDYLYGRYNVQTDCFEQQYKRYKNSELKKRNITKTPERSTNNEDIADVMGLKVAYMGYREQLRKNNGACPILSGFEQFNCEQLFFIAFGNVFCAASAPWAEERILLRDSHNFPSIRVNGAVANMKEFHDAFHCKPKDPKQMCDIWK